jgi:transmembrane sensor
MGISEQEFKSLLERYLTKTASQRERDLLDRFFDSYRKEVSDPSLPEDHLRIQQEMMRNITAKIRFRSESRRPSTVKLLLRIAAVFTIFGLAYLFMEERFTSSDNQIAESILVEEKTKKGQKLLMQLSDGTEVTLNGDSKISFSQSFQPSIREVTVTGEAYFKVVKDKRPFVVHLNGAMTEVLGTSFNVKNIPGTNIEVTLEEGSVNVVSQNGKSAILKPNQQAIVNLSNADILTKDVNVLRYTSWTDNILYFEETTLKEVVATLETWYDVEIALDSALEGCVITGKYQDEPLANVLGSFQFLLDLTITGLEERNITISGKGCK